MNPAYYSPFCNGCTYTPLPPRDQLGVLSGARLYPARLLRHQSQRNHHIESPVGILLLTRSSQTKIAEHSDELHHGERIQNRSASCIEQMDMNNTSTPPCTLGVHCLGCPVSTVAIWSSYLGLGGLAASKSAWFDQTPHDVAIADTYIRWLGTPLCAPGCELSGCRSLEPTGFFGR